MLVQARTTVQLSGLLVSNNLLLLKGKPKNSLNEARTAVQLSGLLLVADNVLLLKGINPINSFNVGMK